MGFRMPLLVLVLLLGCNSDTPITNQPPPPPPVPLALAVNPPSRIASAQPGAGAPGDNAAITLTGDSASQAGWTAANRHGWVSLVTAAGTGTGAVTWTRSTAGLASGIYVDTITITAPGAAGSPAMVIDTLLITTAPVPLTLVVSPHWRSASAVENTAAPDDNVAITLLGDGAASTAWTAANRRAWTVRTADGGTGSGTLTWHRNTTSLAVGTYIDTITITAPGASGSPVSVIDTLRITAAPVPLVLAVSPHSYSVSVAAGGTAPGSTAAVTLTGDNASSTAWTATKKKAWTTLTAAAAVGSGTLAWSRSTAGLAAGTYVDTISVSAAGASGSPALVIDTMLVTATGGGGGGGITADLGVLADLHGKQVFPSSDPWNQPVDTAQVDPNSAAILARVGVTKSLHPDWGPTWGFPYIVVPDNTARVPVTFDYWYESDLGPYPIPPNPPIEGGGDLSGDAHLLVITQSEWKLYEMFYVQPDGSGGWAAGSGAIFDLVNGTQRPAGWTSADAAGLPIFPGLVRYDEVYGTGVITHALRFTITHTRRAYLPPATHWASQATDPLLPPMGMRVRLRADFDISGYPAPMQVILRGLKKYGMMVADNGGDFFVSGTIDPRWNDDYDNLLKQVKVGDFEVIRMTGMVTP